MKKFFLYAMMMLTALTVTWGCSSSSNDDEDNNGGGNQTTKWIKTSGSPDWKIDWFANDEAPSWNGPVVERYESWMILMVKLQPQLAEYSTDKDLMAVFIGNELRAVAKPAINLGDNKDVNFILKILGNEDSDKSVNITLKYYNYQLRHMFTLQGNEKFVPEIVYGVEEPFMPDLLTGSSKYPVMTKLSVFLPSAAQQALTPQLGDIVAVMVGNECRGLAIVDEHLFAAPYDISVFSMGEGETGTIFYYNAREKAIWNTGESVALTGNEKRVDVTF